jgi:hypothetical protein
MTSSVTVDAMKTRMRRSVLQLQTTPAPPVARPTTDAANSTHLHDTALHTSSAHKQESAENQIPDVVYTLAGKGGGNATAYVKSFGIEAAAALRDGAAAATRRTSRPHAAGGGR